MPDFRPHLDLLLWPLEAEVVARWGREVTGASVSSLSGDGVLVMESWPEVLTDDSGQPYEWLHHWRISPLLPERFYIVALAAKEAMDGDGNGNESAMLQFLLPAPDEPSLLPHGSSALEGGLERAGQALLPRRQALIQRVRRFPDPEAWYFPDFLLPLLFDQGGAELLAVLPPLTAYQQWPQLNQRRGTAWAVKRLLELLFGKMPALAEGAPFRRWWRLDVFLDLVTQPPPQQLLLVPSAVRLMAPARTQLQRVVVGEDRSSLLVFSQQGRGLSGGAVLSHAGGVQLQPGDPTFYDQHFDTNFSWRNAPPTLVFAAP